MPPSTSTTPNLTRKKKWIADELRKIAVLMGGEVTPERISLTVDELIHIDQDRLTKAFALARRECIYFPRPAEIIKLVRREPQILSGPGGELV